MPSANQLRTLHIDIEGGWGGSSRSLFELLNLLIQDGLKPVVVHKRTGPVIEKYRALGVETVHVPEIETYVPRPSSQWRDLVLKLPGLMRQDKAAARVLDIARTHRAELIHLNYEGLFQLAKFIKQRSSIPIVSHFRASSLSTSMIAKFMSASLARNVDHAFFISPKEKEWFETMQPQSRLARNIVWNISPPPVRREENRKPPTIAYLGSIDPSKGTDRLVELAAELNRINAPPVKLMVYGVARKNSRYHQRIQQNIDQMSLHDRIELAGYVNNPASVLAHAFALIRPSRWNDPWGRDVIEAVTAGVPVLATGTFEGVVMPGKTGWLFPEFDARAIAQQIDILLHDPQLWSSISATCIEVGREKFLGKQQRDIVMREFRQLAGAA